MIIREHAKSIKAIVGLFLWCISATLLRLNEPSLFLVLVLLIGLIFIEVASNNNKTDENLFTRIRYIVYLIMITGIIRVSNEYAYIEVVIRTLMLSNLVYVGSCLLAFMHTLKILSKENPDSKILLNIMGKRNV